MDLVSTWLANLFFSMVKEGFYETLGMLVLETPVLNRLEVWALDLGHRIGR